MRTAHTEYLMKKRTMIVLLVCLVALLVASLVACDPDPQNPLGPENPTQTVYTVTFDDNGAIYSFDELKVSLKVKYGETIPKPTHDGKDIVLEKDGYTFDGWTVDGNAFEFGKTEITGNTVIKAKFVANTYYHIPDIYGTLKYEGGVFSIDRTGHASKGTTGDILWSDETLKYSDNTPVKDENGRDIRVPQTDITLTSDAFGSNTRFYSTYNANPSGRLPVPTRQAEDGAEKDNFCFWYYLQEVKKKDSEETELRPVQFSEWAVKGATDVAVRTVTYSYLEPLHLYAMFESDLPKVTVEYYESEQSEQPLRSDQYRLGKKITEDEKYIPAAADTLEHKNDYELDYWYYVYETESEEEDGDPVRHVETFIFDKLDSNGESTVSDATSPMDAAHDSDVPSAEQNFHPVTLKLYATWAKEITLFSADDFSSLRSTLESLYADSEKADELSAYLNAHIKVTGEIAFGSETFAPLFDAKHPFAGSVDGAAYETDEDGVQTITSKAKITGASFAGELFASIFGYVNGEIKNLDLDNCTFTLTGVGSPSYLGSFASVCRGQISNCSADNITFVLPQNAGFTYVGGIAAALFADADGKTNGSVNDCYAKINALSATARGITLGGLVGDSGPNTTISNSSAELHIAKITSTLEQGSYSGLRIGGIAGSSVATVSACDATVQIADIDAAGTALIGGLIGQSAGSVERSHSTFEVASAKLGSSAPLQTAALGGLVGLNESSIINSYSNVKFTSVVAKADQRVYVGGLVGSNNSARGDSESDQEKGTGAINRCYTTGTINVSAAENVKSAELFVGGMVGFSKHSKFARNFSTQMTITVSHSDASLVHAGFLFGELAKSAVFTSGYYANDNAITVNGKTVHGSDYTSKEEGKDDAGASDDAAAKEADIFSLGTPRPATDFTNPDIVFGSLSQKDTNLGWIGGNESSDNVWEITKDEQETNLLPSLVDIGYRK